MKLTPVSKGSYVDIFADITFSEKAGEMIGLIAQPLVFKPTGNQVSRNKPFLTLPVKEARQFARTLLALTRQDGDVENEREKEIRELKEKVEVLEGSKDGE